MPKKTRGDICHLTHEAAPDPSGAAYYYHKSVKHKGDNA